MDDPRYVPGECNIGTEEIARRRAFGWGALAVTVVTFLGLTKTRANRWWRVLLFFPAAASASGFLQARLHFCAGFSRLGVYNFGPTGETHKVVDAAAKAKDRRRGNQIGLYAALVGAAVSAVAVIVGPRKRTV
jgi:hypothetical protein